MFRGNGAPFRVQAFFAQRMAGQRAGTICESGQAGLALQKLAFWFAILSHEHGGYEIDITPSFPSSVLQSVDATSTFLGNSYAFSII